MPSTAIAVIGTGSSGSLLALHLLRHCPPGTHVLLIGRGGTDTLLTMQAGQISAFPDRLEVLRVRVQAIDDSGAALRLHLDDGQTVTADCAVLAVGNLPPAPVRTGDPSFDPSFWTSPFYRPDPWAQDALAGLDRAAPVLLVGTGLTTVGLAIALLDQGHRGPIHALSRHGLLPHPHLPVPLPPSQAWAAEARLPDTMPPRVLPLLRFVRAAARTADAAGGGWRSVVDGLRPGPQATWQAMPLEERRRFLRHVQPWWDAHRHRMAPEVALRIRTARADGQLRVRAGRIQGFAIECDEVAVTYRPKHAQRLSALRVARVVNCAGPGVDFDRIADPLLRDLLARGVVRPDALRLGLEVTDACALLHRDGSIARRLFAVGPATRGAFGDITAVPAISRQCAQLAGHLAGLAAI